MFSPSEYHRCGGRARVGGVGGPAFRSALQCSLPERASEFKKLVGPALSMINPSLVFITGDLTDGKSKDLLTMTQNEQEWIEYSNVMTDVVESSGLPMKIFYDLRGNHDNFGVSEAGGMYDYFQKYSINAALGRAGNVHSVTLQSSGWKHLFVAIDTTPNIGLRGPTNLFGHPTDQLLETIDSELSQWDSESTKLLTKTSFGHFPMSFSAVTESGRSLKDLFLKHSLSAYLCGHLHTKFGKNLKRHYSSDNSHSLSEKYFQFNIHSSPPNRGTRSENCSEKAKTPKEFWEWEMGDWRKSRAMRVLAIDAGHISFVDLDLVSGPRKTIILPTFPLDSRFMQRMSSPNEYACESLSASSYDTIRALVFSVSKISSVLVKIFDSRSGSFDLVLAQAMKKQEINNSRGDLYTTPWNWKAFSDHSPNRFWMQVEATDISGRSSFSQLRPFSINGLTTKVDWKWKEFLVMGCHMASLYHPIFYSILLSLLSLLVIPKALLLSSRKNYKYKNFSSYSSERSICRRIVAGAFWMLMELSRMTAVWCCLLLYVVYLTFFHWLSGHVFTETGTVGYMTRKGWFFKSSTGQQSFVDVPEVMVLVLPHLCFVLLPTILIMAALAAEKAAFHDYYISVTVKKEDDLSEGSEKFAKRATSHGLLGFCWGRWIRKILLAVCLAIFWTHWKTCRIIFKAYDVNPLFYSPVYCFTVPLLLIYVIYSTTGF
ncbi:putative metallophosphoesterase [Acorus calamus]|uniref:Metallophosphoesterase n=1 Tax=Acorus calamus TaxID=4465 RepID=A0AAV9EZC0_ACOCL|nr:putative metallophosphoesterase [Acorus calamus]